MPMCSAFGCSNKTHKNKGYSFHKFPFSKPAMVKKWTQNLKRENWTPRKHSVLCSEHFSEESFDRTGQIVRLRDHAEPTIFNFPNHLQQVTRKRKSLVNHGKVTDIQSENSITECFDTNVCSSSVLSHDHCYNMSPKKMKMNLEKANDKNDKLVKQLRCTKLRNSRLKKKVKDIISSVRKTSLMSSGALEVLESTFTGVPCEILQRMLKNLSSKSVTREQYPPLLKKFALTLQFYSTKAYNYVRDTFGLALPHVSAIRSWCSNINAEPGFSGEAIHALESKVAEYTAIGKKVICSLMLDEMSIKKHVEWDGNQYRGFIDLGTGIEGDDLPLATEALVFMIVSLDCSWKIPVAYYFIRSLTGEERANLVSAVIAKLFDLGVTVTSLTCDGPSCHFSMMNKLGAKLQLPNPVHWFAHPCDPSLKVYVVLDVCHMLKLIRNSWAKLGAFKTPAGESIEWRYITALHEVQEQEGLRAGNKLRLAHLLFHQQKMKVNLAAQTMSDSVADALTFCCDILKLPQFQDVKPTVEFIKLINKLFDLLNSRNPFGKGSKAPLSSKNKDEWMPFFSAAMKYLSEVTDPAGRLMYTTPLKTAFVGFYISTKSVISIFHDIVDSPTNQLSYLLTYKLSQDHLELLFCAIRARGGWNNNPNVLQFISAYRKLLLPHQIQRVGTAVTAQDGTAILHVTKNYIEDDSNPNIDISDITSSRLHDIELHCNHAELEMSDIPEITTSEYLENTIAYISGYVVQMVIKVIHCEECTTALSADCESDLRLGLCTVKSRGHLILPSTDVINICLCTERYFRRYLLTCGSKFPSQIKNQHIEKMVLNVLTQMGNKVFLHLNNHILNSVVENNHIFRLVKCITRSYLKIRLYHEGKKFTENVHRHLVRKTLTRLVIVKNQ